MEALSLCLSGFTLLAITMRYVGEHTKETGVTENERAVTLDDVAQQSGVSRATASRALGSKPGVASEVRERVRLIAEAMNYRPNPAARQLAGAKTSIVGLIVGTSQLHTNQYTARLVDAISVAAERFDQGLLLVASSLEPAKAIDNLVRDGLVDGLLVNSFVFGEPWAEQLLETSLAKVLIGQHPTRTDLPTVAIENVESTAELVGHLIDRGCKRVGMIEGPGNRRDAHLRRVGFELAHQQRDLPIVADLIVPGYYDHESGFAGAHRLLDRDVDGIFAANDASGLGALGAIRDRGLQIPSDIRVASFDGVAEQQFEGHRLTAMEQPFDLMAMTAMRKILNLEDTPEDVTILKPTLRAGSTS